MNRVGFGFDLHPLEPDRPLVLGGVTVPSDLGLGGHSDADVLTHALCEALLGALALGDLGSHFPDSDERYRNVSSLRLLAEVRSLVEARGGGIVNADVTVVAQAPRLGPHLPQMAKHLADTLGIDVGRVSVKAKSPEHLGLLGRREGIAAMAVVAVEVRGAAEGEPSEKNPKMSRREKRNPESQREPVGKGGTRKASVNPPGKAEPAKQHQPMP